MAGKTPKKSTQVAKKAAARRVAAKPTLLSGGNPQIAKADGDTPVRAYIAAMPGWKRDLGKRLDALIVRNVPNVRKAVKWNSPFYGIDGRSWFLSFHVFTLHVRPSRATRPPASPTSPSAPRRGRPRECRSSARPCPCLRVERGAAPCRGKRSPSAATWSTRL